MHTLFILCSCLLQRHWKSICTFVKLKRGGVVRILSLLSTVHNFHPQISVHRFLSTDHNFRLHCTLTILIHCSLACMNELQMKKLHNNHIWNSTQYELKARGGDCHLNGKMGAQGKKKCFEGKSNKMYRIQILGCGSNSGQSFITIFIHFIISTYDLYSSILFIN